MVLRLGIDVGGTHTDAVLLTETDTIIAKSKRPTTSDVVSGIRNAVAAVLGSGDVNSREIRYAMLGTTQCTNAVVERRGLATVGVLRIGAPASLAIPPLTDWPEDLIDAIQPSVAVVHGGHEFDGGEISPLDEAAIRRFAETARDKQAIAVTSVFSPATEDHEIRAAAIVREVLGATIPISLSAEIGSIGLLERENATVLNAALAAVAARATAAFRHAMQEHDIDARLYFSQNDGTLMDLSRAEQYPILTVASGPTNSLRGAAYLSGFKDAIVIDVGGTTSDVGMLIRGFPRQASQAVEIGGVPTNFRMPDLLSIGVGGGTRIRGGNGDPVSVGPDSVGYLLSEKAWVFGGKDLTLTDVAVARGRTIIGDAEHVAELDPEITQNVSNQVYDLLSNAVDHIKTAAMDVPVVAVGGGSFLVPPNLAGASMVVNPDHGDVANAIGAAMAQVSGEVDRVFHLEGRTRQAAIEEARNAAVAQAIDTGGDPNTVEIIDIEEVPLAYLPGNATRIRIKVAAKLLQGQISHS